MKVGIIVYSEIGHTLSVAKQLAEKMHELKYDITLEEIKIVRHSKSDRTDFAIIQEPSLKDYDLLIMGSFVEGFMLTPVMKEYLLNQSFSDQKVIFYLTHYFPFPWMGGTQTINEVSKLFASKNMSLSSTAIINWSRQKEKTIEEFIESTLEFINEQ